MNIKRLKDFELAIANIIPATCVQHIPQRPLVVHAIKGSRFLTTKLNYYNIIVYIIIIIIVIIIVYNNIVY